MPFLLVPVFCCCFCWGWCWDTCCVILQHKIWAHRQAGKARRGRHAQEHNSKAHLLLLSELLREMISHQKTNNELLKLNWDPIAHNPRPIILICFAYGLLESLCAWTARERLENGRQRTVHAAQPQWESQACIVDRTHGCLCLQGAVHPTTTGLKGEDAL